MLRPRVLGYGAVLAVVAVGLAVGLLLRQDVHIDIIKDRGVMVRQNQDGWLENAYNLRISNTGERAKILTASVSGLEDIKITGLPEGGLRVGGNDSISIPVQVAVLPDYAERGSNPIVFTFRYADTEKPAEADTITTKSTFTGE